MSDLNKLYEIILSRKTDGDPSVSYVAKLFQKGRGTIAQKVGEEATETIIAALSETAESVAQESADLLFHLCILWAECGVTPKQVMDILANREGISGLIEKENRKI
jgi:phosphoribosyl-ATP pyrophosphohydrolase